MRRKDFWFGVVLFLVLGLGGVANAGTWAKTYGGQGDDVARHVIVTSDGKYVVAGFTNSFGPPLENAWIFVTDKNGNVEWQKVYGGSSWDYANKIKKILDGYIMVGYTNSPSIGWKYDFWVAKLDSQLDTVWVKSYGGIYHEYAFTFEQATDGGYVIAGYTDSFGQGEEELWIIKLDSTGNIMWQKAYGGVGADRAASIEQTSDGGYIVAGYSNSFGNSGLDVWLLKLDESGNVQWEKRYGGQSTEYASEVYQTSDGGYILSAHTYSFGAGSKDIWLLKLDANGNIQWQKTYGGQNIDEPRSILQTSDGGYIVAGGTVSFGSGSKDIWVLRLDSGGNILWEKTYGGSGIDEANFIEKTEEGGYIVAGNTTSFGAGKFDVWLLKIDANGNVEGCDCVKNTNATVTNTNVTAASTNATVTTTNASINSFSPASMVSNASVSQVVGGSSNYKLTITKSGMGEALVTSNPAGINCGDDCTETYSSKAPVTLSVQPDESSVLGNWSGDCADCGKSSTCTILVASDKNCGVKIISALKQGWNLLSLTGESNKNIGEIISGKSEKITSVWKWIKNQQTEGKWAVYLPGQSDGGSAYASQKGFDIISSINVGEGFWINVKNLEQGEKFTIE